ncbi:MAG: hypothetical protein OXT67_01930 [Zetaproteobacteria bacterium]|nr:hypothetical protein [Zetaproteobacteria bacterium]
MGIGLTTHSSELLSSVATSNSTGYQLGFFGGREYEFEALIRNDTNTTAFAYANRDETSTLTTVFADNILRGYWGSMYLGVTFSTTDIVGELYQQAHLNMLSTGVGGNAGINYPFTKKNSFFLDITSVGASVTKDMVHVTAGETTTAMGNRMDISLGAASSLARGWLDFFIGYRQRTFSLSLDSTTSNETVTATLLGLNLHHTW